MDNYNEQIELIQNVRDLEDLLNLGKQYYSKLTNVQCSLIFNGSIYNRKINLDRKNSLRTIVNTALLFISNSRSSLFFSKKMIQLNFEMEEKIFLAFCSKIELFYLTSQSTKLDAPDMDAMTAFFSYHLNYSTISTGEYLQYFKALDNLSISIYGFSIYRTCELLLKFTSSAMFTKDGKVTKESIFIPKKHLKESKRNCGLNEFNLDVLFLNFSEVRDQSVYPTDIPRKFMGKIGIKFRNGYYIPLSEAILENLLRGIVENSKSNDIKGPLFEKLVKPKLEAFFKEASIYHSYHYDENKKLGNEKEQDFLVIQDKKIYIIECKAQNMKEVFRDQSRALKRLRNRFNGVLNNACEQCDRIAKYISGNDPAIFWTKNFKSKFYIHNGKTYNIYKIVLTFDDYLNLAESPSKFTKKNLDIWITNISALDRILWKCTNPTQFEEYVRYRTSGIKQIRSISANELDQFGAYFSPNYGNIIRNFPQKDIGISIALMGGFSKMFDEYDKEIFIEEWSKLINHKKQ